MKNILSSATVKIILLLLFIFQLAKINDQILGADAGAILPASRDIIIHGAIPYINLYTIYTPLSYYLYGILYLFSEIPSMQMVMYYNCLFILFSGLIFHRITPKSPFRDSIVLLYLLSVTPLIFDVKIETMGLPLLILLGSQASTLLDRSSPAQSQSALYRSSILIGILFLLKQYYMVLFPMTCILYLIGSDKTILHSFKALLLSFAICLLTISIILLCMLRFEITNLNPELFLRQLSGKFILAECASYSSTSTPLATLYHYARYSLLLYPFLIAILVLIIFSRTLADKILWFLFLLTPCVLFSFNVNPHYMFIFAPYILVLFTRISLRKEWTILYFNISPSRMNILVAMLLFSYSFYVLRNHVYADILYITHYKNIKKTYQDSEAELAHVEASIGHNQKTYLGDGINKMFTYRLGLESINAKEIGYIFLYGSCLDTAFSRYASNDSKLLNTQDLKSEHTHDPLH